MDIPAKFPARSFHLAFALVPMCLYKNIIMAYVVCIPNFEVDAWPWYLGRVKKLKDGEDGVGPVVYWMSRDHRSRDNWALLHAVHQAREKGVPVAVAFNLVDNFLGAKARHFGFMLRGLRVVERNLMAVNIPFFLLLVRLFSQNCSSHLLLPSVDSPIRTHLIIYG